MSAATRNRVTVEGHVGRGFEAGRDAFEENFARCRELGGACCAYHRGENVVDQEPMARTCLLGPRSALIAPAVKNSGDQDVAVVSVLADVVLDSERSNARSELSTAAKSVDRGSD